MVDLSAAGQPIRLKVSYKSPEALVAEYTRTLAKGCCSIEARRSVPVGTRFVLEMRSPRNPTPVEVEGRVTFVTSVNGGETWLLGVQYVAPEDKRDRLEKVIAQVFAPHQYEAKRKHPRIPLDSAATDPASPSTRYRIRDISMGGMGIRVGGHSQPPPGICVGTRLFIAFDSPDGSNAELAGEVVWTTSAPEGFGDAMLGVRFCDPSHLARGYLERMVHLRTIPWRVTLQFLRKK